MRETTPGHFFDGRTSKRHLATLTSECNGRIRIEATGLQREYPLAEVRIGPQVGSIPCSLYFPDGAKCELADEGFVRRLSEEQGRAGGALTLHLLESRLGYALAALVLTAIVVWGVVSFGVPALAKQAAFALPQSANIALGQGALEALDHTLFSPSDLDKATQNRIQRHFTAIAPEAGGSCPYRLELRKGGPVGANALALPSGIVVMTDELVRLAQNDEELIAVLAHELGHLV
ncbi:MAG: M48 family metallopeptidase [Gammaproteobacteria bacterium]